MASPSILAAKQFKHNNPSAKFNVEICNFKRLNELLKDTSVFVRKFVNGLTLKVYYYA